MAPSCCSKRTMICLSCVWILENSKERKKNIKKNYFLMFLVIYMKFFKENKIQQKIVRNFYILNHLIFILMS